MSTTGLLNKEALCQEAAAAAGKDSSASQSAASTNKADEKSLSTDESADTACRQGKSNAENANENKAVQDLIDQARLSLSKNNAGAALKLLTRALQLDSASIAARRLAAMSYFKLNAAQQAIKQLRFVLASSSADCSDWALAGDAYLSLRAYEKAIQAYKGALRLNADCHQAHAGVIRILALQGQYNEALAQCSLLRQKYGNEKMVEAYYQALYKMVLALKQNQKQNQNRNTQNSSQPGDPEFQLRPYGQGGLGGG